jgi:hypothetical protein
MVAKKKPSKDEEDDMVEEEGPDHFEEDLDELDDDMLVDDGDEPGREDDEVLQMLREVECSSCDGSSSRSKCKVRDQHGCPDDKADK